MKDPASLHMCLFCAIVFEVNPSIVWFLTAHESPKTERRFVGLLITEPVKTTSTYLHICIAGCPYHRNV